MHSPILGLGIFRKRLRGITVQANYTGLYVLSYGCSIPYGNYSLSCGYGGDMIAKHDLQGNVIWVKQMIGVQSADMSVDRAGNSYIVGSCSSATFCGVNNTLTVTNPGDMNAFIVKYVDHICPIVYKERPEIPLFTIHDCIVTTVEHEEYLVETMLKTLKNALGEPPKIKPEFWHVDNLSKKIDELQKLCSERIEEHYWKETEDLYWMCKLTLFSSHLKI